ncbi:peptidylprolyl isomerase A [Limnobaculum zhutongyuii]|uniref:Peptidyl-prolyl cis-trans isomerase n=1 Tax=Limnobaculum zhutongyuii TaxID=2498113 RepID=A0A411WPS4_9GAMM|nr:peptidylprolyl isomerase [Limnobaculum zhutongyuii]QBH98249.1 peptidylprolyl isomerase A [Limnobaculum zhutongyuii]TQS89855.1 peptidylprolyl isomerase A [Limnobaculum zhutongyuii]
MLKRICITLTALFSLVLLAPAALAANPHVVLTTSLGNIEIELDQDKAPISTKNFVTYVKDGFYDGTIFHRVIPGFMAQGGGFTAEMNQKKPNAPIKNEAANGLKNVRGTIAMARTNAVDSATSQFFINVVDNDFLDQSAGNFGYAVFGKVVKGMDVVDQMMKEKTQFSGQHQDVPVTPIVIKSAKVMP